MSSRGLPARVAAQRVLSSALFLAVASTAANVLSYGFNGLMSRQLGPAQFGRLASLLSVLLVVGVPALALQAVAARRTSIARSTASATRLVQQALRVGGLVTVGLLACTPLLVDFLHVRGLDVLWLALNVVPLLLVGASQGLLQGAERFRALGVLFVAAAAGRLVGGLLGLALGGGVAGVLIGTAAGGAAAAALGLALAPGWAHGRLTASTREGAPLTKELAVASGSLLGVVLLTNMDLLLARHYLSAADAGAYAVGSLMSKVAFWLPQAVATIAFPRLADPARRAEAVRTAVAALLTSGAVVTLGALALARPAIHVLGGGSYVGVASSAWLFAASGALLALSQLLLYARLARLDGRVVLAVALVLMLEVLLVVTVEHDSIRQIITTTASCALLLVVVGAVAELADLDGEVLEQVVVGDQELLAAGPPLLDGTAAPRAET